jgi:hypothetical protein
MGKMQLLKLENGVLWKLQQTVSKSAETLVKLVLKPFLLPSFPTKNTSICYIIGTIEKSL